jgi:hypothetical protein
MVSGFISFVNLKNTFLITFDNGAAVLYTGDVPVSIFANKGEAISFVKSFYGGLCWRTTL